MDGNRCKLANWFDDMLHKIGSALLISALTLYFVASVLNQVLVLAAHRKGNQRFAWLLRGIRRLSHALYAPSWNFFYYVVEVNNHILIRDRLVDDQLTPWRAIKYVSMPWLRFLWNPDRRRAKKCLMLAGSVVQILAKLQDHDLSRVVDSGDYQMLAEGVRSISRSPLSVSRQFMIVRTGVGDRPRREEILFVSPLFPIECGEA
jgi:hypothetical protein